MLLHILVWQKCIPLLKQRTHTSYARVARCTGNTTRYAKSNSNNVGDAAWMPFHHVKWPTHMLIKWPTSDPRFTLRRDAPKRPHHCTKVTHERGSLQRNEETLLPTLERVNHTVTIHALLWTGETFVTQQYPVNNACLQFSGEAHRRSAEAKCRGEAQRRSTDAKHRGEAQRGRSLWNPYKSFGNLHGFLINH